MKQRAPLRILSEAQVDQSSVNNARVVIERARADLAEARERGLDVLAEMLDKRLVDCHDRLADYERVAPLVESAHAASRDAESEEIRARRAREFGALDRKEALRLVAEHEHARQVVTVRAREHKAVLDSAMRSLQGINTHLFDRAREAAETTARSLAMQCLRGRSDIQIGDPHVGAEVAAWEPFFEARELAVYEERAASKEYAVQRAHPIHRLRSLFDSRKAQRKARVQQLEAQLQSARTALT